MTTTPADAVRAAAEQALAMTDPAQRCRAITDILKAVEDDKRLTHARETDLRTLRETLTLREISEQVGLSIGRIDQIVKRTVTGRRTKGGVAEEPS
jgi:gamma-glutamyl phosphate reductase